MTISNSAVMDNEDGGIYNDGGIVSLSNSTVWNNAAPGGSNGGGLANAGGTVNSKGSIVAGNSDGGNCSGAVSDQGYNLSDDAICGFTGTGSLQNTNPQLDPNGLQNNGGPTRTIALQQDSPAIDAIPTVSGDCPATSPVSASFTVTVNGAATQISNQETIVNSFHFKKGIQITLDAELQAALKAVNQGKTKDACVALDLFIGEVKFLTGRGISASQANQLLAAAKQIQTVLGCP